MAGSLRSQLPLALLLSVAGLASEAPPLMVQAALALPQSDLKRWTGGSPGFGLGVYSLRDVGNGEVFRARLEVFSFHGHPTLEVPPYLGGPLQTQTMNNNFFMASAGLDSVYYFHDLVHEGIYLFAGVGLTYSRLSSVVDSAGTGFIELWPMAGASFNNSSYKLNLSLGMGYQFSKALGLETRVAWTRGDFRPVNLKLTTATLGLTYRFLPVTTNHW